MINFFVFNKNIILIFILKSNIGKIVLKNIKGICFFYLGWYASSKRESLYSIGQGL